MSSTDSISALAVLDKLIAGCETIKCALLGLRDSQRRVADEVHAIRKLGKSLRGGFAIFRLERSAGVQIQAIGRLLAGSRDAVSRASTWDKIGWNDDPATAAAVNGLLEIQISAASRRPPEATIHWCLARVDAAIAALQALPEAKLARRFDSGTRTIEQRALKRTHQLDRRNPADFHEARKALKAWLGAADYLPAGTLTIPPLYVDLAETLGDENDLATLAHWLERHGFSQRITPDLQATLAKRRRQIQKSVMKKAAGPKIRSKTSAETSAG